MSAFPCVLLLLLMASVNVATQFVCPSNEAFRHNGIFYQFFDCLTTWEKAEAACKNNMFANGRRISGGHLISVLDEEEQDWLKFQLDMRYGTSVGVWIGAKRVNHGPNSCPESFFWTDGSPFSFQLFSNGQPNCRWPGEDCLHVMENNERWNDAECQGFMRFVCKAKAPRNFDVDP